MSPQSPRMYSHAIEGKPRYHPSSRHLEDESSGSNKLYGKGARRKSLSQVPAYAAYGFQTKPLTITSTCSLPSPSE